MQDLFHPCPEVCSAKGTSLRATQAHARTSLPATPPVHKICTNVKVLVQKGQIVEVASRFAQCWRLFTSLLVEALSRNQLFVFTVWKLKYQNLWRWERCCKVLGYHVQEVDIRPWNKRGVHNTRKKLPSSGLPRTRQRWAWGWQSTSTAHPGKLQDFPSWRSLEAIWTRSWATGSKWPCLSNPVAQDDLWRSLPTLQLHYDSANISWVRKCHCNLSFFFFRINCTFCSIFSNLMKCWAVVPITRALFRTWLTTQTGRIPRKYHYWINTSMKMD